MAVGTGTALVAAAIIAAGSSAYSVNRSTKSSKRSANIQRDALEADKIANQQAAAAPGQAAAKAKEDALRRRRGRAKTLLTSSTGVGETATIKKTLLGA